MTLRYFKKELPVSVQEYNTMMTKTIISCDVTRVLGTSGSDYIFIVFNDRIRCISLFSGQTVVRKGPLPSADDEQEEKEEDTENVQDVHSHVHRQKQLCRQTGSVEDVYHNTKSSDCPT
ncbi:hypothetical protein DPMN_133794 [Dreissena polymorpha]|uniref:Uncharacterized protein n=1 Tax=Dreissena polymorpha TaxID=45954 RepID=A0A9D4JA43_DREPO|nr:hypothetical protein DPMN_133794 [Dreissena polymorpha]